MSGTTQDGGLPLVPGAYLRPYGSAIILIYVGSDAADGLQRLFAKVRELALRQRGEMTMVASGLDDVSGRLWTDNNADGIDDLDAFVASRTIEPSWLAGEPVFADTVHQLAIGVRRRHLIAVHCEPSVRDRIQRWLDKDPRPPFRRVPPATLQAAFVEGEVRGLWLRGTHPRRATKADSENLVGTRLQEALNPFEHGSFAMGSARAEMPESSDRTALKGVVGVTPRRSLMWVGPTDGLDTFVVVMGEALHLIKELLDSGTELERPFPELAVEVDDLEDVWGAYDLEVVALDDLQRDASPDLADAAALLARATLEVRGELSSANFDIDVGFGGTGAGIVRMTLSSAQGRLALRPSTKAGQQYLGPDLATIRDALEHTELLTVRYESGHGFTDGSIFTDDHVDSTFHNWQWMDFGESELEREKPCTCGRTPRSSCRCTPQDIHDAICTSGERSLFSWVVACFNDGWLTCDDGSGEVADFIHVDVDGCLSFIHVKAAKSSSAQRGVAVDAYGVVTNQAVKNLHYVQPRAALVEKLGQPSVARPATWTEGKLADSRADILDVVKSRRASDETRIVIVQPHLRSDLYDTLKNHPDPGRRTADTARLSLLEYVLNSARRTAVGLNADLTVISANI